MAIPLAALIVILIALFAGAIALSAFVWAVRTKQFSIQQLNQGAYMVFDEQEPAGVPQDMVFGSPGETSATNAPLADQHPPSSFSDSSSHGKA